jgi:ERCC4-related helicase
MMYQDLGAEANTAEISGFRQFLLNRIRGSYELSALRDNDSKFDYLANTLREYFVNHPEEKVVLFSYFRGTLHYLKDRLQEIGIEATVLMGGMKEDKSIVISNFQNDPALRTLQSSEVEAKALISSSPASW